MRGATLGDLVDKPWSQVSSLLPSGTRLRFYRKEGSHSHCFAGLLPSSISIEFAVSRVRAFGLSILDFVKKSDAGFEPTTSTSMVKRDTVEQPANRHL